MPKDTSDNATNTTEALKRIAEAKRTSDTSLTLSDLKLTTIPERVRELKNISKLILSNNSLSDLPMWIRELINLQELDVSSNRIISLPNSLQSLRNLIKFRAASNNLTEVPQFIEKCANLKIIELDRNSITAAPSWLFNLTKLEKLDLSSNKLSELPISWNLPHLQTLTLYANNIHSIPDNIGHLTKLKHLSISANPIHTLPEKTSNLTSIVSLCIGGTKILQLPECIRKLTQLEYLSFGYNNIIQIPDWIGELVNLIGIESSGNNIVYRWESHTRAWTTKNSPRHTGLEKLPEGLLSLKKLKHLYLHGNDNLGIPPELLGPDWSPHHTKNYIDQRKLGRESINKILSYYFKTKKNSRPLNEAKLILVGRGGAGKTSLIQRLIFNSFKSNESETSGITIQPWEVTIPSGENVRLHVWDFGGQRILHGTHQFFLTERTIYLIVLSGREDGATQDAEYWLQLIRSFGGNSKVIIALNKSTAHPFDVNRGLLIEKYPFIADFVKTDCATGLGLNEIKNTLINQVDSMEHRKTMFPGDWFLIKERLASMHESHITWSDYQKICKSYGEVDDKAHKDLAGFLHILGIALNYSDDPRLNDTRVLKPTWVTEGIYTILRAGQKAQRGGLISTSSLCELLNQEIYPSSKHDFLIRLMEKFRLCFKVNGANDQYLVPELLGENQPDIKNILDAPGLGFRYQYQALPESILPRFIVQSHIHSEQSPEWRWRTGVVLSRDGCQAVIRADVRERRVDIHISGPEKRRRGLLAIIREKFDEQHFELKGLIVDERVPLNNANGLTISYRDLLMRETRGETEFYPENSDQAMSVTKLLDGVEKAEDRLARRLYAAGQETTIELATEPANMTHSGNIFISYSHKDEKFYQEFTEHLKPFSKKYKISYWSDKKIKIGTQWRDAIAGAIGTATIAILLVSPSFLASDFIIDHELEPILKRASESGLLIMWIPTRPCAYQETQLKSLQTAVIAPSRPLSKMSKTERDESWVKICAHIRDSLLAV